MDYNRFLSDISKNRKCNILREMSKVFVEAPPSCVSFGGGSPSPKMFPFESIQVNAKDGLTFALEGKDLVKALQYGASEGVLELRDWLMQIQKKYHNPPLLKEDNLNLIVTVGCQDGLSKAFHMLLSPGDNVLVESLIFPGTLSVLKPLPINLIGLEVDEDGIIPDNLLKALSKWDPKDANDPNSDIPKVLYTVPNGGNPTGATAPTERKKKIYEIAQLYNLIIIEDDPYYFLQFQEEIAPSYQSMDTDGRVIRFDSLSKVISPGLRVGWVSAAKPLVEKILNDQQSNVLHTATLSQVLVLKLLDSWQMDGFEKHVKSLQTFYQSQRDLMIASATKWLDGLAEWSVPKSGFYLWMRFPKHSDTMKQLFKQSLENELIIIPGESFSYIDGIPSSYCRLSYSVATAEQMEEGFRRLAKVIEQGIE